MRRSALATIDVARWGDRLARQILSGEIEASAVVRVLEPYASAKRQQLLRAVFARRIDNVTIVLDAVCDPHNGAALLRTCEAFGLARVHVIQRGASSLLAHAGVTRGTHKWVQTCSHRSAKECVEMLGGAGYVLVACDPRGELTPEDLAGMPRVALVLGNEHAGIAPELREACAHAVRVPMRGFAESLNVSVCGGILLAFATQGRDGDLSALEQERLYARGLAVSVPHAEALLDRCHGT